MSQIRVGAAIGAGFGLIRRRPISVISWGLLPLILQVAAVALLAPFYIGLFETLIRQVQSGSTSPPDISALVPQMMMNTGLVQLINLAQIFVSAMVYCAVYRAVLHPDRAMFGYLRLGVPELLMIIMIPIFIIIGITAASAGHGPGMGIAFMMPVIFLVMFLILIFVGLRFAFVGPMMVEDGKFHLFESWTETRGKVGSLILILLGLIGIAIVAELIIGAVVTALGAGAFFGIIGGPDHAIAFFQQSPSAILTSLAPILGVYLVLLVPLSGCAVAIFAAPWASAYKDLRPDTSAAFV
jgi:hypothetical protein